MPQTVDTHTHTHTLLQSSTYVHLVYTYVVKQFMMIGVTGFCRCQLHAVNYLYTALTAHPLYIFSPICMGRRFVLCSLGRPVVTLQELSAVEEGRECS